VVRRPEDSPGKDRGYKQIVGADYGKSLGRNLSFKAEHMWLRNGETDLDPNHEVTDFLLTLEPEPQKSVSIGWSRDTNQDGNFFRLQGKLPAAESAWLEPILLMKDNGLRSFGISLRVKF
jgi:hypothetical protein